MRMLMAWCWLCALVASAEAGALRGAVQDENGKGVAGATVYVVRVRQKAAYEYRAQNFFADWGKKALSDADGKFVIEGVEDDKQFDVLVAAEGFESKWVKAPVGKEITAKLKKLDPEKWPAEKTIRGVVKDADGKPVWGAGVVPFGYKAGTERWWSGGDSEEAATVTNEKGEFVLPMLYRFNPKKEIEQMDVRIYARGFAPLNTSLVSPGEDVKEFVVTAGATITGRLLHEGKGVKGAVIVAEQDEAERERPSVETRVGHFDVQTDDEGRYTIAHVTANDKYLVHATMQSLGERGVMPAQKVATGADGESVDAGEVELVAGRVVAGRIKMADGKAIKPNSAVQLSLDGTDSLEAKLGTEGTFKFVGVPAGVVWLHVNINGYRPSAENVSFEKVNGNCLLGLVEEDVTNLVVLMEEGKIEHDHQGDQQLLRGQKLAGVEGKEEAR
ncbi:MAG TPA: carboxypeptidase-like regulatory domain-containing protein [Tepidisphaeraceae bacterium]|jgi:hypothetical protein